MKSEPLVSVMMAAYNAEDFIKAAIESIFSQTYKNWELVILNDGSTDRTKEVIHSFQDLRLKYFENQSNMGLVYTRNRIISLCKGEYLAVLDSDDVAYPDRLEKEVQFLEQHSAFGLVGSSIEMIDAEGALTGGVWDLPAKDDEIATILFFHNNFAHSTVMYRKSLLPTPAYREGFAPAEDYDLWVRLCQSCSAHNFQKPLVAYRVHGTNTSFSDIGRLIAAEKKIIHENAERLLNSELSTEQAQLLYQIFFHKLQAPLSPAILEVVTQLFERLSGSFPGKMKNLRRTTFNSYLLKYFLEVLNLQRASATQKFRRILCVRIGLLHERIDLIMRILAKKLVNLLRRGT
ncbi:MAG: glycosyltransferase [Turneriella sp.]|nr:glycosyltransferase [Turneriella sp.]